MKNSRLISIGEALIDFIPNKTGCAIDEVTSFEAKVGGAPANVCGAFAKLGGNSMLITQLGEDFFGKKIANELKDYGIDTSAIAFTDKANTGLAFVCLASDGNRTFSFYRNPSADMLFSKKQLKKEWFEEAYALHFCSVSLGDFPMKEAHEKAIEMAREQHVLVSFDPNLRLPLWKNHERLCQRVNEFIPKCDILKISDEELFFITGETDITLALSSFFDKGVKLVIYTCGKKGAYAYTKEANAFAPALEVKAKDTTGAGDGFIGSFLWKMKSLGISYDNLEEIKSDVLKDCLIFSNKFCAFSVQTEGAIASYPTLAMLSNL